MAALTASEVCSRPRSLSCAHTVIQGFITVPLPLIKSLDKHLPLGYRFTTTVPLAALDTADKGYIKLPVAKTQHHLWPAIRATSFFIAYTASITTLVYCLVRFTLEFL